MKNYLYFLVFIILFSCIKTPKNKEELPEELKPSASIVQKHQQYENVKGIFLKEIDGWNQYRNLNEFISKYTTISANEALNNALELKDLTVSFKDSLKPKILDLPSFNARINVLHNETLRLSDMTFISAIKSEEVNTQVDKILLAFSAVNSKINTIFLQKKFEDAIDVDDFYIGLDSTKLDSISIKSIEKIEKSSPNRNFPKKELKFSSKVLKKQ